MENHGYWDEKKTSFSPLQVILIPLPFESILLECLNFSEVFY